MHLATRPLSTVKTTVRAICAGTLCSLVIAQPLLAAGLPFSSPKQIQGDERTLHALNRLTFGPKPGDVAAVDAIGLSKWFEQQLNPSSIDDSALDARLAAFPAMRLPQDVLMRRFPSPAVIRTMEKQNLPLPSDPVDHAVYADQIAFYKMREEKKASTKPGDDTAGAKQPAPDAMMDMASRTLAQHDDKLYPSSDTAGILSLQPAERMHRLLTMSPKDLVSFRSSLTQPELAQLVLGLTAEQKEILASLPGSQRLVAGEVLQTRLLRDIYSNRQIEAVMTDFWLNHFNVYLRKNQNEPFLLPAYERDVIRPHALGKFEDLLVATAESSAMLMYLDNWQSIGPNSPAAKQAATRQMRNPDAPVKGASGLNENYARELMELHTLGVNGGYTQSDVTQVAKVFTGWTIDKPYLGASYEFEPRRHEPGPKQVLGTTIRAGDQEEGLQVLHLLATSPATARFISNKLAVRFVADTPSPALVDWMAKSFLASGGDIKTVLRTMFNSPEFWAPAVVRAKVKTPLEFVASAARASNAEITNAQPLVQSLDKLGMPLYGMQTPNGYSWLGENWVSTGALVSRMNFALVLTAGRLPGVHTGLDPLVEQPATVRPAALATSGADEATISKERRLESILLGQPASDRTRQTVLNQSHDITAPQRAEKDFAVRAGDADMGDESQGMTRKGKRDPLTNQQAAVRASDTQTGVMAGLLIGSPEFQRR